MKKRIIVGISGATGIAYAVRILELLRNLSVETHLVVTQAADRTRAEETDLSSRQLRELGSVTYNVTDVGAAIASGSFRTAGMIVAPCSMHTLAEIAQANASNLLTRAADVCLKERRRGLVADPRDPASLGSSPEHVVGLRDGCGGYASGSCVLSEADQHRRDGPPYLSARSGSFRSGCGCTALGRVTGLHKK